jgi:8-oxo-dGTP pyrophosphatase MutT (NUDIX family)
VRVLEAKSEQKTAVAVKGQPEKMFVGVKAMIFRVRETGEKEIFMLRAKSRALGKDGWRWDIPGGRVDKAEHQTEETLIRELGEEIPGVKNIKMGRILGIELVTRASLSARVALCYYEVLADLSTAEIGDEHYGSEWVSVKQVRKLRNSDGGTPDWLGIFNQQSINY